MASGRRPIERRMALLPHYSKREAKATFDSFHATPERAYPEPLSGAEFWVWLAPNQAFVSSPSMNAIYAPSRDRLRRFQELSDCYRNGTPKTVKPEQQPPSCDFTTSPRPALRFGKMASDQLGSYVRAAYEPFSCKEFCNGSVTGIYCDSRCPYRWRRRQGNCSGFIATCEERHRD
jgi:hypothetical protein